MEFIINQDNSNLSYDKILDIKQSEIKQIFPQSNKIIPSPQTKFFLNHLKFYVKKINHIITIEKLNKSTLDDYFPSLFFKIKDTLTSLIEKYSFSIYHPKTKKGFLRGFSIKYSFNENTVMIIFFTKSGDVTDKELFFHELMEKHPEIVSIYQNSDEQKLDSLSHSNKLYKHLYGEKFLINQFDCSIKYKISPSSRIYNNSKQTEFYYQFVIDALKISKNDKILNLFCGSGLLDLLLSKKSKIIYGVDQDKNCIRDAVSNSKINRIENTLFLQKSFREWPSIKQIIQDNIDITIIKLPNKTFTDQLLNLLESIKTKKIVILSSLNNSIEENIALLNDLGYQTKIVQPFDFLPEIELFILLSKKEKIKINMSKKNRS